MIIFYDIAARSPIKTWSPNPWKTRYVLNYKKLPYNTFALEYPDIAGNFEKLGIPPLCIRRNGIPLYTSPSIIDETTQARITDSYKIAEYLDQAYPSSPPVFPAGTEALQAAFYDNFERLLDPVWPLLWPRFPTDVLNPVSAEHFTRTRTGYFGKPLADVEPKGEERVETWKKVEAAFYTLYGWLSRSSGPFFMGETITFSDFVVAGMLDAIRITLGEESEEWQKVEAFNGGRWKEFLESLKQYASVDK